VRLSPGGVGRNIAAGAACILRGVLGARRGGRVPARAPVHMLSAVGQDALGRSLVESLRGAGVYPDLVQRVAGARTDIVAATLRPDGEVAVCVADVGLGERAVLPGAVARCAGTVLRRGAVVVLDANLSAATLAAAARLARSLGCVVLAETVSVAKALRLTREALRHCDLATPNVAELRAMAARLREEAPPAGGARPPGPPRGGALTAATGGPGAGPDGGEAEGLLRSLADDLGTVLSTGLGAVLVTMGEAGAALCRRGAGEGAGAGGDAVRCVVSPAVPVAGVRSLVGAGDSLVAGVAAALASGWSGDALVLACGAVAASRSVASEDNVPEESLLAPGFLEQAEAHARLAYVVQVGPSGGAALPPALSSGG